MHVVYIKQPFMRMHTGNTVTRLFKFKNNVQKDKKKEIKISFKNEYEIPTKISLSYSLKSNIEK